MSTSSLSCSVTCLVNTLLLLAVVGVAISKSDFSFAAGGFSSAGTRGADLLAGTTSDSRESNSDSQHYAPTTVLEDTPSSKYHIFVASKPDTGSTLLVNMLLGLFDKNLEAKVGFLHFDLTIVKPEGAHIDDTVVTKTHIQDLDVLSTHFQDDYDQVFVIVPNRSEARLEDRYCSHPYYANRVLCLEYEDFTYSDPTKMKDSISYVADRIRGSFPYFGKVELLEDNAMKRIQDMEAMVSIMAKMDFSAVDDRFGIHGGHKGRKEDGQ
mmetsp:Transcript_5360/g.9103  ORF Transcript_5360/g.9103 Transcript_5360/m.9103 type:complete len:267 (-) Transcript_5360:546-1346(-)